MLKLKLALAGYSLLASDLLRDFFHAKVCDPFRALLSSHLFSGLALAIFVNVEDLWSAYDREENVGDRKQTNLSFLNSRLYCLLQQMHLWTKITRFFEKTNRQKPAHPSMPECIQSYWPFHPQSRILTLRIPCWKKTTEFLFFIFLIYFHCFYPVLDISSPRVFTQFWDLFSKKEIKGDVAV